MVWMVEMVRMGAGGFKGQIHCQKATANLCSIMLRDSAHIQEFEAEWKSRKGKRKGSPDVVPLYTIEDAERAIKALCGHEYEEKIELCKIVTEVKADYIKTSTGFGSAGATLDDIKLFKKHIGPDVKIKAAGGIRTIEDALAYAEEGCSRIGSSKVAPLIAAKYNL